MGATAADSSPKVRWKKSSLETSLTGPTSNIIEHLFSNCDLPSINKKENLIIGFIRGTLGYGATGIDLSGKAL